ncbi:hypothetical protein [Actinomadura sp. B10D3]
MAREGATVRHLLAHGADPDLRDPATGRTPSECCGPRAKVAAVLRPLTGR